MRPLWLGGFRQGKRGEGKSKHILDTGVARRSCFSLSKYTHFKGKTALNIRKNMQCCFKKSQIIVNLIV